MSTILIVDDHATNRELLVTLLKHMGHEPLEAADGVEGLALVRARRPRLVICDILMPTMDGYEFVRQLRADPEISDTEVIFNTANYHVREAQHLAASVGVTQVLVKPSIPEDIILAIEYALESKPLPAKVADYEAFDREHLRLITDKLAEKADDLQLANQRLSALTDLNLQLASVHDPDILLKKVCDGARELMGSKYAIVCIKAKNNGQAIHHYSSGLDDDVAAALPCPVIDAGLFSEVVSKTRSRRVINRGGDPQLIGFPPSYPKAHFVLIAPIVSLRLTYGWICLVDKIGAEEFSAEDERLLTIHAAQVGRIYENGSLYKQVERRAAELAAEVTVRKAAEQELMYKNSVLQTQQKASPDAILLVNEDMKIVSINPQFGELFGIAPDLLVEGDDAPVLAAVIERVADQEGFVARVRHLYESHDEVSNEEILLKGGRVIDRHSSPVRSEDGIYRGRIWYFRDITERKAAEQKIRRLNRVYLMLSSINGLIVHVNDRNELYRQSCKIAVEAGEFATAYIAMIDPQSREIQMLVSSSNDPEHLLHIRKQLEYGLHHDSAKMKAVSDQVLFSQKPVIANDVAADLPLEYVSTPSYAGVRSAAVLPLIVAGKTIGFFGLRARETGFFDVPEVKLLMELAGDISFALDHIAKSEKLEYLAYHDALTGLANRTLFFDRLERVVEQSGRDKQMAAVLILNIDRFKAINDAYGRPAGDDLLKQIVARFVDDLKNQDQISCARLSADNFAFLIPQVGAADEVARLIEAKIKQYFGIPFRVGNADLRISVRVGAALFPDDGADAEALFRNAEAALKNAKARGERYMFHTLAMTERVAEHLNLENRLRHAVEQQQFVLHYQPKLTLEERRITGVEALIRWNDPQTGLVPPLHFIPLLEETGMIHEVGSWALRQAITDHARWRDLGLISPRVAVNVSAIQLRNGDFVETVRREIGQGVAPAGIDLEITESVIMDDIEGNIRKLNALRDMGLGISIDDFGTGYSSLAYLAKLPVNEIKIDRSFIVTMLRDENVRTLVLAIIAMAHSMNLSVVAEGVEEEAQAEVLLNFGCERMQGYLFSKPVPFEEMAALLARESQTS